MAEATSKKQHNMEYIAIGVLVAAAIIIGIARFKKGDVDDEVFSRKEFNNRWKEVEALEANLPNKEGAVSYAIENNSMPFKGPLDEVAVESKIPEENILLPEMQFQGMIWRSSRPQAVVNNKVYDIKDVITVSGEKIEVKDINKDGIHLIYKKKEFIVRPK